MPLQLAGRTLLEYLQLSPICRCIKGVRQFNILMPLESPVQLSGSSSNKIISYDKQVVALGKQNAIAACPKEKLEFKLLNKVYT